MLSYIVRLFVAVCMRSGVAIKKKKNYFSVG